jgi:hypothetical protein
MKFALLLFLYMVLGVVLSMRGFRVLVLILTISCTWALLILGHLFGRPEMGIVEFAFWIVASAVTIQLGYFAGVLIRAYRTPKADTAPATKPVSHSRR